MLDGGCGPGMRRKRIRARLRGGGRSGWCVVVGGPRADLRSGSECAASEAISGERVEVLVTVGDVQQGG